MKKSSGTRENDLLFIIFQKNIILEHGLGLWVINGSSSWIRSLGNAVIVLICFACLQEK
jgi:hypothetical protein